MQPPPLLTLFLLIGGTAVLGTCVVAQTCYPSQVTVDPMQDIDINRLMGKKWYVQEVFFRRAELVVEPHHNCYMQYIVPHLVGTFTHLVEQYTDIEGGVTTHNGSYVIYPTLGNNDAVWDVRLVVRDQYRAIYTHTDYENYGIMHWCPHEGAVHDYERVVTFTGTPNPDQTLLEQLQGKVASLGYPAENRVQISHHADCNYVLCQVKDDEGEEAACCDPTVANVPPMKDMDMERLMYKSWYVQEIFFRNSADHQDVNLSCFVQTLVPFWDEMPIFSETHTDDIAGIQSSNNSYVPIKPGSNLAVWEVVSAKYLDKYTAVWTHTDFETYGVMHYCAYHENLDYQPERILTFTQTPFPAQALIAELREKVAGTRFPTEHVVPVHHHADCDYEYHYVDDDSISNLADQDFEL